MAEVIPWGRGKDGDRFWREVIYPDIISYVDDKDIINEFYHYNPRLLAELY